MEEQLIAQLQKEVPGEGATLYSHLCDLIGKCKDNPADALARLEEISQELKYERFRPQQGPDTRKKMEDDPVAEEEKRGKQLLMGVDYSSRK